MNNGTNGYNGHAAKSILVVDDDLVLPELFRGLFGYHGFGNVRTAIGVHAAKAEVDRLSPDIILMDTQMPVQSGPELYSDLVASGYTGIGYGMSNIAPAFWQQAQSAWAEAGVKRFFPKMDIGSVEGAKLVLDAIVNDSAVAHKNLLGDQSIPTPLLKY